MRVVQLDRMRVDAVREDRPLGPQRRLGDDGGERGALVRAHAREHARDGVGRVDTAAARGAADVVEQQLPGVRERAGVDVGVAQAGDPGREGLGRRVTA